MALVEEGIFPHKSLFAVALLASGKGAVVISTFSLFALAQNLAPANPAGHEII